MGLLAIELGSSAAAAPQRREAPAWALAGQAIARGALRLLGWYYRAEVEGADRLPRGRPVIFVAKRPRSWGLAEPLLLAAAAPGGRLCHQQHAGTLPGVVARLAARLGAIPATREATLEALRRGESVLVFPGGERELHGPRDTILWHGRRGYARLAALTGAPVVPVAFDGADRQHPWAVRLSARRALWLPLLPLPVKLIVRVGEPVAPPASTDAGAVAAFSEGVAHATRLLLLPSRRRARRGVLPRW